VGSTDHPLIGSPRDDPESPTPETLMTVIKSIKKQKHVQDNAVVAPILGGCAAAAAVHGADNLRDWRGPIWDCGG
jgi:hypothetical protein